LVEYLNGKKIVPINIEISPCGICNADCSWCFYKNQQSHKMIETKTLIKFINESFDLGTKAITWTGGGEPTLHPDFKLLVENIKMDQGLITNGLKIPNFNPLLFSWIRVSKTNKDWNLDALNELRKCKSVGLCINYQGNEFEVESTLKIVYDLKLDYLQVRPALKLNGDKIKVEKPTISDSKLLITNYKFEESFKEKKYSKCEGFHFVPFLWEDGDLDVCAYKKGNKKYNLGNIYMSSLKTIIDNFPSFVNVERDCQTCCKNHEINSLISVLKEIQDINFV